MSRAYLAFTEKGMALAHRLARALPGSVSRCGAGGVRLAEWTSTQFAQADALIFVGAVGIAVRAIAPHCKSKATDPAVVVLDECGRFAVPLLSGHLGGANALARALAEACGAIPVITTATDANGVFAVDEWAKAQGCAVLEPERIKLVSGALLAGHTVRLASDWPVQGTPPAGVALAGAGEAADFALTLTPGKTAPEALHLVPRVGVLGVGCKRGTTADQLEAAFAAFCAAHGWPITFYTARQLQAVEGHFTPSAFVRSVTGVDNVCERAAVCAADGPLQVPKQAGGGVTLALAAKPFAPDWSWKDAEP